jgi:hypothetical protein
VIKIGKSEFKSDLKKGIGYMIETALVLGNPVVLRVCIQQISDIDLISFIVGMYAAFTLVCIILIQKHWGSFGKEDLDVARARAKGVQNDATTNLTMVDNQESNDIIEAKKQNITIEKFKEKKYGNPTYDYGKSAQAEKDKQAQIALLQEQLTKLQTPAPASVPSPTIEVKK